MNKLMKKKEFLKVTDAQDLKVYDFDNFVPQNHLSFPWGELSSLGAVFSALPTAFSNIAPIAEKTKTLYEATFPVAGHLAEAKDGSGFLGTILNKKGIAGQARFNPVNVKNAADTVASTSTLFMALAIMAINKSLKDISETQKNIICFLEIDKQSQLKGDLIVLSDIISEYQHNWNNEQYRNNREMQVLDIKRSAEQNILFYQEMINNKFNNKEFIHLDTSKKLNEIQSKFRYYKLALYQYSFSSFLGIMLLGNFETPYLESVVSKINSYSLQYNEFYNETINKIEKYLTSSLQSRALQGVSVAGSFIGKQISKIPDKNNRIKADESLIAGSEKINEFNKKSICKAIDSFTALENSGINMFTDKIKLIDNLYNKPIKMVFDAENIYLLNRAE